MSRRKGYGVVRQQRVSWSGEQRASEAGGGKHGQFFQVYPKYSCAPLPLDEWPLVHLVYCCLYSGSGPRGAEPPCPIMHQSPRTQAQLGLLPMERSGTPAYSRPVSKISVPDETLTRPPRRASALVVAELAPALGLVRVRVRVRVRVSARACC